MVLKRTLLAFGEGQSVIVGLSQESQDVEFPSFSPLAKGNPVVTVASKSARTYFQSPPGGQNWPAESHLG